MLIRHPLASVGAMVATGILAAAIASWLIAIPHATGPAYHWGLATTNGRYAEIPRDATVVKILTDPWPGCHPYDEWNGTTSNGSWLVADVSYSSESVTITLHQSSSFDASKCLGWYDTWGLPVEISLREPLNGRTLLDGSSSPPRERPYH
jgi:hypothetical protein